MKSGEVKQTLHSLDGSAPVGEFTCDCLFDGGLRVLQPRQGYRFSVDAVLLAHFIFPPPRSRVIDLGTGCGILPLLLSYRHPGLEGIAVELQPRLAALARKNFSNQGLEASWRVEELDLRQLPERLPADSCDWAISNPPYRRAGSSRRNSLSERAVARHEVCADLASVASAMRHVLRPGGRAAVVYPASRTAALLSTFRAADLEPKRLQIVYDHPGGQAKLVLLEAGKGAGEEMTILPPFHLHDGRGGRFAAELIDCYRP